MTLACVSRASRIIRASIEHIFSLFNWQYETRKLYTRDISCGYAREKKGSRLLPSSHANIGAASKLRDASCWPNIPVCGGRGKIRLLWSKLNMEQQLLLDTCGRNFILERVVCATCFSPSAIVQTYIRANKRNNLDSNPINVSVSEREMHGTYTYMRDVLRKKSLLHFIQLPFSFSLPNNQGYIRRTEV